MNLFKTEYSSLKEGEFLTDLLRGDMLLVKWIGFCTSEIYQYGFLKAVEITSEKHVKKWLLDFSEIKVVSPENQKWTFDILISKINKAGVTKIAVVNPQCPLASASVKCMYEDFKALITYERKIFPGKEPAMKWLKEI